MLYLACPICEIHRGATENQWASACRHIRFPALSCQIPNPKKYHPIPKKYYLIPKKYHPIPKKYHPIRKKYHPIHGQDKKSNARENPLHYSKMCKQKFMMNSALQFLQIFCLRPAECITELKQLRQQESHSI